MSEFDNFDDLPIEEVEVPEVTASYEKCIILGVKDLGNFCRLVEPLTKAAIDECGKSVYFTCLDTETVEVRYYNKPYVIIERIPNKSGTVVKDFAILVSTLKNLLTNSFSEIEFVEKGDELSLAFGDQLIYVETKNLRKELYQFSKKAVEGVIDYETANYVFKVVGSILNSTERASEKVVVVKDGTATFNTGVFAAGIKSPFSGDESMVIYKQVSDCIATISDIAKADIKYGVGDVLTVETENFYCEFPVGLGDRVQSFVSPSTQFALQFNANTKVNDEQLYGLVKLVQSLDYLSDIVKVGFTGSEMVFELSTENGSRKFPYKFPVVEGKPEVTGEMNITVDILKVFLDIVGAEVSYEFNNLGLGIQNELGHFLIRKS